MSSATERRLKQLKTDLVWKESVLLFQLEIDLLVYQAALSAPVPPAPKAKISECMAEIEAEMEKTKLVVSELKEMIRNMEWLMEGQVV